MQPRLKRWFEILHGTDAHRRVYLALVAAAVLLSVPLFEGLENFGRRDWDQLTFRYETPRTAVLRDHQLPLWNPYVNGGTVLLAHPASPFPSPFYLPVMALGAQFGLRVQVVLFVALGAVGAAVLLRRWGASASGSFVGGVLFMMSAHFTLHIAEGHLEWCVLGLMPWVILGLLRGADEPRLIIATGLLLSAALMLGSVYIVAIYLPFIALWSFLESLRRRSPQLLLSFAGAVTLMVVLSSVKLLPQLEFASSNPRPEKAANVGLSTPGLAHVFLDPRQDRSYWAMRDVEAERQAAERGVPNGHVVDLPPGASRAIHAKLRASGAVDEWHEYGAYLTWPGLALALLGVVAFWRTMWPLYVAGAVALVVMLSATSPINLWALLQRLPLYTSLTVPSRFVGAVVLVLSVAAALGTTWLILRLRMRWTRLALGVVVPIAIFVELAALTWRLWGNIFVYPATALPAHDAFSTRYTWVSTNYPGMYSYTTPLIRAQSGAIEGYENLQVRRAGVTIEGDPSYPGELFLQGGRRPVDIQSWSMSRVSASVAVDSQETLVLNQNHFTGWKAAIQGSGGTREQVALAGPTGLVTVSLYEGDRYVTLFYRPDSFIRGGWISILSWTTCIGLLLLWRRPSHRLLLEPATK